MSEMEAALSELDASLLQIKTVIDGHQAVTIGADGGINSLKETADVLLDHSSQLQGAIDQLEHSLAALASTLDANDVAENLSVSIGDVAREGEEAIDAEIGAFSSAAEHLTASAEEAIGEFATQIADRIGSELLESIAQIEHLTRDATTAFGESIRHMLEEIVSGLVQKVHDRLVSVIDTAVKTIIDRLLNEITDTMAMTLIGAQNTALISPYIVEIAILLKLVDAIQQALDTIRAGG